LPPNVIFQTLKYTKFDFGWDSAPNPARGAYSAPEKHLAGLRGPTSKGRDKKKRKTGGGKQKKRKKGKSLQ